MNITVTKSKMCRAGYESSASCTLAFDFYNELSKKYSPREIHEKLGFLGDNRKRFRKMWGSVSFCYNGAHFYQNWAFRVGHGSFYAIYIVGTAKNKGTTYEVIGRRTSTALSDVDLAFLEWLVEQFKANPPSSGV